jgi:hypothetical protein
MCRAAPLLATIHQTSANQSEAIFVRSVLKNTSSVKKHVARYVPQHLSWNPASSQQKLPSVEQAGNHLQQGEVPLQKDIIAVGSLCPIMPRSNTAGILAHHFVIRVIVLLISIFCRESLWRFSG